MFRNDLFSSVQIYNRTPIRYVVMFLLGIVIVIVPHILLLRQLQVSTMRLDGYTRGLLACSAHIRESLREMLASGSECCYYTDDHSYSTEVLRDTLELACKSL